MVAAALCTVLSFGSFRYSTTLTSVRSVQPRRAYVRSAAVVPPITEEFDFQPTLSGLNGKALEPGYLQKIPTKAQVRAVIPKHCYRRQTWRSLGCLLQSLGTTALASSLGLLIPLKLTALPLWIAYAAITGTSAMGLWVLAHECGHGAFSDNQILQHAVGFVLHSSLLVPYFSWQRSHAVHHARTNHIYEGETHVPTVVGGNPTQETTGGEEQLDMAKRMGVWRHGAYQLFGHLMVR